MTKPTLPMLDAISQTSLLDDVFGEDPVTNELQSYIAKRTGHKSSLLVMSGKALKPFYHNTLEVDAIHVLYLSRLTLTLTRDYGKPISY